MRSYDDMKVVVSLWGGIDFYNLGCIENAELCRSVYPGSKYVVYHDDTVPEATLCEVRARGGILRRMPSHEGLSGAFWRYLELFEPDSRYLLFRDTDSRLCEREKVLVNAWLLSGMPVHIMRDHPRHIVPIMAGLFDVYAPALSYLRSDMDAWRQRYRYGDDQFFLEYHVYKKFASRAMVHSSSVYYPPERVSPISAERVNGEFLGGLVGRPNEEENRIMAAHHKGVTRGWSRLNPMRRLCLFLRFIVLPKFWLFK